MSISDYSFLKSKAAIFKALGHPTRLWIMEKLEGGEACVCEFVNEAKADFSTISAHLAVMQKAGLISGDKRGREVYYSSRVPCIYEFMNCVENVIKKQLAESADILKIQEEKNGNQNLRDGMQKMQDSRGSCAGGDCRTRSGSDGD